MPLPLHNDDVLSSFAPGKGSVSSLIWLLESSCSIGCAIGILIAAVLIARGMFVQALAVFFMSLIAGLAPKIAPIFFY